MKNFKWCNHRYNCNGECPKDKCYICPWNTWEFGPNEDYYPTSQEYQEDIVKAYTDPRKYAIRITFNNNHQLVSEIKEISDAIKYANKINTPDTTRVEIIRVGLNYPVASIKF